MSHDDELLIGLVSISDRASSGGYKDEGIPLCRNGSPAPGTPWRHGNQAHPDERPLIEATLAQLADSVGCHLVLTTGGTGRRRGMSTPRQRSRSPTR